jgi:hypothetical protein
VTLMNAVRLYDTEDEQRQHLRAIEGVAKDLHRPVEEVRSLYETELAALRQEARVKDFLSVLASRYVRLQLKRGTTWQ